MKNKTQGKKTFLTDREIGMGKVNAPPPTPNNANILHVCTLYI